MSDPNDHTNNLNLNLQMIQQQAAAAAQQQPPPPMGGGFELEEALFATAPVGLHCVDSQGIILWANQTELQFLGFSTKEEYVGQYVSSFVYSDKYSGGSSAADQHQHQQGAQLGGLTNAVADADGEAGAGGEPHDQHQANGGGGSQVNLITADDKTLYKEVLKRVTGGNPINEIPVRFVTRSGTVIHLLLDCDGTAILRQGANTTSIYTNNEHSSRYYYRFFTRDDTSRRIQEMRSNVLFQETNRSLQMLDNFMNRSMQQMRAPLTLMERACNLVTENIEDIDEVIRRNAAASMMIQNHQAAVGNNSSGGNSIAVGDGSSNAASPLRRSSGSRQNLQSFEADEDNGKPHALPPTPNNKKSSSISQYDNTTNLNFMAAPLTVALSATLEARSVVGLATTLTKDALALVDDITDLCRFDQGRVLLIEKEAVKVRDICLEALMKVPIPVGSNGMVDVVLDIQEGAPGRTMTDRSVLQRSLALLLNFAVDAAANAASTAGMSGAKGKVILSVMRGSKSACKISVFYTNPPSDGASGQQSSIGIMGSAISGEPSATAFASAYTSHQLSTGGSNNNDVINSSSTTNKSRRNSFGKLPAIFGECYSKPTNEEHEEVLQNYHTAQGGSMMRRIRVRENIQSGMTSCRRDKLGLGLSLLYHLVGAQGSDLRYEIVSEQQPPSPTLGGQRRARVVLPTMTKFWFLLPVSLDFPGRLPAEIIVKHDLQGGGVDNPQVAGQRLPISLPDRSPLLPSSFSMAPDDGMGIQQPPRQKRGDDELGIQQQPRQKRAKIPHQLDPLNSILSANVMGAMDNTATLFNRPEVAAVISAPIESTTAAVASAASNNVPSNAVAAAAAAPTAIKQYPGVAPGARPLVLVVEDTDVSASLLCMHLRKLNCTSHRAENGEVAIEMLRSAPAPNMYSLILMDLRMPVMDGFEATKIIKGSNASNIPVVALTGETSEENRQRCDEIGFDDYNTKPLKRPQLKELLNKFVPGYTSVG